MHDVPIGALLENSVEARKHTQPATMRQSARNSALKSAEFCGRWWFDPASAQLSLSDRAARYLQVDAGSHSQLVESFNAVVLDDLLPLVSHVSSRSSTTPSMDIRVISSVHGLRWLRMRKLPEDPCHPRIVSGTVVDITSNSLAATGGL
jgi:hypothetical protein